MKPARRNTWTNITVYLYNISSFASFIKIYKQLSHTKTKGDKNQSTKLSAGKKYKLTFKEALFDITLKMQLAVFSFVDEEIILLEICAFTFSYSIAMTN